MTKRGAAVPVPWLAASVLLSGLVSGCSLFAGEEADPYAEAVEDYPAVYCYRTLGDADCHKRPVPGAEERLVNYYGPPPADYDRPPAPPPIRLDPPPDGADPVAAAEAAANPPLPPAGPLLATPPPAAVPAAVPASANRPIPPAAPAPAPPQAATPAANQPTRLFPGPGAGEKIMRL